MGALKAGLALLVIGVTGLLSVDRQQTRRGGDDAGTWFLEVQGQVYDAIMPVEIPDVVVAHRMVQTSWSATLERYFAIQRIRFGLYTYPDALMATVIRPVGRSIMQQLVDLKAASPTESLASLLSKLDVKRDTIEVYNCSAILSQVEHLSDVRVSIPRPDRIILDAPTHQFAVKLGPLKMSATIDGEDADLVRWAERTHELIVGCLSRRR